MSAFANATAFFHACESLKGWEGCQQYVEPGAVFNAQSEPIADIESVEGYTEWMAGLGLNILIGCRYELHSSCYDETNRTALFFATFIGTHTGDGGPVPPTNKETRAHYVYALTMGENDLVSDMKKIWNAPWTMKQLGWT